MTDSADRDAPLGAQSESRHMKDTIVALREQIEALRAQQVDELQAAATQADAEVRQLHDTLLGAQSESRHMKDTIVALREQIEALRAQQVDELQAAAAHSDAEVRQLHGTISALRDQARAVRPAARGRSCPTWSGQGGVNWSTARTRFVS